MATLTIGNTRVKVDDSFLSLPKDQQQAVVNKIASSLAAGHQSSAQAAAAVPGVAPSTGQTATPPPGLIPGSQAYKDWAIAQAKAGNTLPQVSPTSPETNPGTDSLSQISAGTAAAADAVPIIGPKLLQGLEQGRAAVQTSLGHPMTAQDVAAETQQLQAQNPTATTVGTVTGRIAPFALGATVPGLATVLGLDATAPVAASAILGGASQKGIDYLDNVVRGQDPNQKVISVGPVQLTSGDIAGIGGALGPVIGAGLGATTDVLGKGAQKVMQGAQAILDPGAAAARQAGTAIAQDIKAAPGSASDLMATANQTGAPTINADYFGQNTKNLLKSSLPSDPDALNALQQTIADRQLTKGNRVTQFFNDVTNGNTNFQTMRNNINAVKTAANDPNYTIAYGAPEAASIWTPKIQAMVAESADDPNSALRQAISMTTATGKNQSVAAAAKGTPVKFPVRNPLRFNSDGSFQLVNGAQPSLPFWDQVQRNLGTIASNTANPYDSANIYAIQHALNGELDATVPAFQTARQGAAAAFGANDALEAGQKFAMSNMDPNEAAAALAQMTPQEQKVFGVGTVSKIANRVDQLSDAPTAIDRLMQPNGKASQQLQVALKGWAPSIQQQLPAYLRLEQAMSDTAKTVSAASARNLLGQTAAQGGAGAVLGGIAGGVTGGSIDPLDWNWRGRVTTGAALGAALMGGSRILGTQINQGIGKRIVQMLSSGDPEDMRAAVVYAAKNPQAGAALQAISHGARALVQSTVGGLSTLPSTATAAQPDQQPEGASP